MRHQTKIILGLCAIFLSVGQLARGGVSPITVTINFPQATVAAGSDVILDVISSNTSTEDVKIPYSHGPVVQEILYMVHITDNLGRVVKHRDYAEETKKTGIPHQMMGSYGDVTLRPGDSVIDKVFLSDMYELRSPGQYVVYLTRRMDADGKIPGIKSNMISLTVTP